MNNQPQRAATRLPLRIARAIVEAVQGAQPMREDAWVLGRIRTYLLPADLTREAFDQWWPRLPETERSRYLVPVRVPRLRWNRWTQREEWSGEYQDTLEAHNVITTNGRNQILSYIGDNTLSGGNTGTIVPFAQYFSVGTGAIASVGAGDTGMIGELFRAVPSSALISGNAVSISTFFGATQANGTYTNAGLFGNNATSSLGSGTLLTHAFYAYTKSSGNSLTTSYLINLN